METLSDKIYIMKGRRIKDFYIEDVKEFIKKLKEGKSKRFRDECDKLAGEKLI